MKCLMIREKFTFNKIHYKKLKRKLWQPVLLKVQQHFDFPCK